MSLFQRTALRLVAHATLCFQGNEKTWHLRRNVLEQSVIHRKSHHRVFQTWFGVVSVRTTTFNMTETKAAGDMESCSKPTESSCANVVVSFTPCFVRFGVYCSIVRQSMGRTQPEIDIKLQLYNVVRKTSSVIQACEEGNIGKMQTLFALGQASPLTDLMARCLFWVLFF
jgi:hypothetical protein